MAASADSSNATSVRVATWNIWWRHGQPEVRAPAILETLQGIDTDVVALQEVSATGPDQPTWLSQELGWNVSVAPIGEREQFGVANVIASPWPIVDTAWRYLDVGDMVPHRTVLWALVDTPQGPLDVFTTHLSHRFDESALRQRQLAEVAQWVADRRANAPTAIPPVLLGDLNAVPDSDEIRTLTGKAPPPVDGLVFTDVWDQVGKGTGATYSAANPNVAESAWPERRIDYVLVSWPRKRPAGNPLRASLFGTEPVDGIFGSDHWGVWADLAAPRSDDAAV